MLVNGDRRVRWKRNVRRHPHLRHGCRRLLHRGTKEHCLHRERNRHHRKAFRHRPDKRRLRTMAPRSAMERRHRMAIHSDMTVTIRYGTATNLGRKAKNRYRTATMTHHTTGPHDTRVTRCISATRWNEKDSRNRPDRTATNLSRDWPPILHCCDPTGLPVLPALTDGVRRCSDDSGKLPRRSGYPSAKSRRTRGSYNRPVGVGPRARSGRQKSEKAGWILPRAA